jgi:hypothetical protein
MPNSTITTTKRSNRTLPTVSERIPSPGNFAFASQPWARLLRVMLQFAVCLSVAIIALEAFLAFNHIGEQEYLKVDPNLGLIHLENKLVTDRSEFYSVSKTSSAGLCDFEHQIPKPSNVLRIALLGDSMTESIQVPLSARFSRLLESKLNAGSSHKFEVLNFGTGAFSTGQEYLQYVSKVRAYKPDLVILMFHQGDESKNGPTVSAWSLRPTFTLNKQGFPQVRFAEFDNWRHSTSSLPLTFFDWGRRNSHIWQALLQVHSVVKNDKTFKRTTDTLERLFYGRSSNTAEATSLQAERKLLCDESCLSEDKGKLQPVDDQQKQWELTLSLISMLNLACKNDGCQLKVISLPAIENRLDFQNQFKSVSSLAMRSGFYAKDLSPSFDAAKNQKTDSLFLIGHLSPRGHALVADVLSKCVKSSY